MVDVRELGKPSITVLGMSGAGKTHLSAIMADADWTHYSADYEIGSLYLRGHIDQSRLRRDNILPISEFIGKLGNTEKGGLAYEEFCERQALYHHAELQTLDDATILCRVGKVMNDTSGSFCELGPPELFAPLAEQSLFVYLDASDEEETLIERGIKYPKPMYFPPKFLGRKLSEYLQQEGLENDQQLDPDHFARWVFPHLFKARIPKYEILAERYGVRIKTESLKNVAKAQDFLDLVAEALHKKEIK